jgi:hypothetical protein
MKMIAANENSEAIIQLNTALHRNLQFPEARLLFGRLLLKSGDMVVAEIELQKAQNHGCASDGLVPELTEAKLGPGKADQVMLEVGAKKLQSLAAQTDLKAIPETSYDSLGSELPVHRFRLGQYYVRAEAKPLTRRLQIKLACGGKVYGQRQPASNFGPVMTDPEVLIRQ